MQRYLSVVPESNLDEEAGSFSYRNSNLLKSAKRLSKKMARKDFNKEVSNAQDDLFKEGSFTDFDGERLLRATESRAAGARAMLNYDWSPGVDLKKQGHSSMSTDVHSNGSHGNANHIVNI
jgi:hypothetical protein